MENLYNLKCPNCGNEFQYYYDFLFPSAELGIVFKYGPNTFSVKCPQCHKRTRYHVTDADIADSKMGNSSNDT